MMLINLMDDIYFYYSKNSNFSIFGMLPRMKKSSTPLTPSLPV